MYKGGVLIYMGGSPINMNIGTGSPILGTGSPKVRGLQYYDTGVIRI